MASWFATWAWPHQGASKTDPLDLQRHCNKGPNAECLGASRWKRQVSTCPAGSSPWDPAPRVLPWKTTSLIATHYSDPPQWSPFFGIQSENLPRGALFHDGASWRGWAMAWEPAGLVMRPWVCLYPGQPAGAREERRGCPPCASGHHWDGASALALPPLGGFGVLLCRGLAPPAPPLGRHSWVLPSHTTMITGPDISNTRVSAFLCYLDSDQGTRGAKFSTLHFNKLLHTLKWQQSPKRLYLASSLNYSVRKQNRNVLFICSQNTTKKQPGKKRVTGVTMAGNRPSFTKPRCRRWKWSWMERVLALKGMRRIMTTDQVL